MDNARRRTVSPSLVGVGCFIVVKPSFTSGERERTLAVRRAEQSNKPLHREKGNITTTPLYYVAPLGIESTVPYYELSTSCHREDPLTSFLLR